MLTCQPDGNRRPEGGEGTRRRASVLRLLDERKTSGVHLPQALHERVGILDAVVRGGAVACDVIGDLRPRGLPGPRVALPDPVECVADKARLLKLALVDAVERFWRSQENRDPREVLADVGLLAEA